MSDSKITTTNGATERSRRSFLKQAALVAGAGIAGTAIASGAERKAPRALGKGSDPRPPKPGEKLRIAVLGVGGMGQGHCGAIASFASKGVEDVEIVAVADVNDLHAASAVKRVTGNGQSSAPEVYRDYRKVLERDDIHGVVIASPEHWHAKMAMDAVHAGKDVYCEKPMTLHLDEALAVQKTVHSNPDVIFVVGTQKMVLPKYLEAKKLVESGAIGKPVFSQTSYCRNSPDGEWNYYKLDPDWKPGVNLDWDEWLGEYGPREWDPKVYIRWRRYRDFSTGILGDLLVHEMTPLILALDSVGWPTRVMATGGHYIDKEMENHDQVNLTIQFEHDHTMIVAGSTCNEVGLENLIRGHEGNIYLNSRHCDLRPTRPYVDMVDARRIECPDIGNDQDLMRQTWLKAMRTREQPSSTVDFATKVMVAVDLSARSIWDGHAYSFDPKTMTARRG